MDVAELGLGTKMIVAFELTVLVDSITLVAALVAAIRRRSLSNMLIGGLAACSTGLALRQLLTGHANVLAPIFTAVLVAVMSFRLAWNARAISQCGRRQ